MNGSSARRRFITMTLGSERLGAWVSGLHSDRPSWILVRRWLDRASDGGREEARRPTDEGIGRGIGRVAAHEFAHLILGAAAVHNDLDEDSYEYPSPDRASQHYGQLHWTTAWPLLRQKLGN